MIPYACSHTGPDMASRGNKHEDDWSLRKPVQISPDKVFKAFFDNLRLDSANCSLVWQAEDMNMPEGTLANVEDYFKKYLASHRSTTILFSPGPPPEDCSFPNIKGGEAIDSGIEDPHDPPRTPSIRCTETQLLDKEYSLYTHALLCAQFPVLSRQPTEPPTPSHQLPTSPFSISSIVFATPPLSPSILSPSLSSGEVAGGFDEGECLVQEETLSCLVREAFRLTEDSHRCYDIAISEGFGGKPPAKILVEELHGRLYLNENHSHPIYHQTAFHVSEPDREQKERLSHELWQQEERMRVHSYISQFWMGPLPAPNHSLCKARYWEHMPLMYRDLLIKLRRHDQQVEGASNHRVILHSSSRRLLKEFALRYGVSDIYQRAVLLEHLSEEENFILDRGFLKTILTDIGRLRDLLLPEDGQCYILKTDLELSLTVLGQLQMRCESKLQVLLQKSLSPHAVGLLLTTLRECLRLLGDIVNQPMEPLSNCIERCIQKCFSNWFNQNRLSLTTKLHLNSYSTPVSAELISKLVVWIQNEVLDYQQKYFAVFESFSVDVNKTACNCYYKKLMVDVQKLNNCILADTESSFAGTTMDLITLARGLDKLGQDWCHVITPSQETWRYLFIRLAHRWLKQIREDLYQLIRQSIEQDNFSGMETPVPSAGIRISHQRIIQSSGNFSPSFGSAFQSVSPVGTSGPGIVCTIQPVGGGREDPFLVEGASSYRGKAPARGGIPTERGKAPAERGKAHGERGKVPFREGDIHDCDEVGNRSRSLRNGASHGSVSVEDCGKEGVRDGGKEGARHCDTIAAGLTATPAVDCPLTVSGGRSSGYGTISAHTRTPAISSVTSSFLQSGGSSAFTCSLAQSCDPRPSTLVRSISVVVAPFSVSVLDFLTMMSCTSQFLRDLCVVLCRESRDFLAAGDFDSLRERLERQQAQCTTGRNDDARREQEELESSEGVAQTLAEILLRSPKEILDILMPIYAASMLYIDLCSTPPAVAATVIPEKALDFVNQLKISGHLPRCRHKRSGQGHCDTFVNRRDDYICNRFEPITPEMCVRINNVATLLSSEKWLFKDQPVVHPFLVERGGEDGDMYTLLEDLYQGQLQVLAYKLNLVLERSMRMLLALNADRSGSSMRPYHTCLHKHLAALSQWLYPQSFHQFCLGLWKLMIQDILLLVKEMPKTGGKTEHRAVQLIQFISKLIETFTRKPYGKLSTEECCKMSQPVLRILELYTMPTSTIIAMYRSILLQNWSSGYLSSESGFLTQDLLDHMSSELHQIRKCFTVADLSSVLHGYAGKIEHSIDCTKEEWMRGVMEEMKDRHFLHAVQIGASGTSSTLHSGSVSPPVQPSSDESEPYTFPAVTVHSYSEPVLLSSSGSSTPTGPRPVPDVRTLMRGLSEEATQRQQPHPQRAVKGGEGVMNGVESASYGEQATGHGRDHTSNQGNECGGDDSKSGVVKSGDGDEGVELRDDPEGMMGEEERERSEVKAQGQASVSEIEGGMDSVASVGEANHANGNSVGLEVKVTVHASEGAAAGSETEGSKLGVMTKLGVGTDLQQQEPLNELEAPREGDMVQNTADSGSLHCKMGLPDPGSQEDIVQGGSSVLEEDPNREAWTADDQQPVRPKQNSCNISSAVYEGEIRIVDDAAAELPLNERPNSIEHPMDSKEQQVSDSDQDGEANAGPTGSARVGFSDASTSNIFAELEGRSDFYRLSLPLQMQADGLQLGSGVSNADVLRDIIKSRRRHDRMAMGFMQSLGSFHQWTLCPLC